MLRRCGRRLPTVIFLVLTSLAVVMAAAVATGRIAFVGTTGVSMNPVYYQGDFVVVVRADAYEVGDIVAYRSTGKHIVVLHRIIGGDASGYTIKGDHNQSIDSSHPRATDLIGRAVWHVPHGAVWAGRLTSPIALMLWLLGLATGTGTAVHVRRRRRRTAMPTPTRPGNRSMRSTFARKPTLRTAAVALAAVAAVGVALGASAWTASPDQAATGSTQVNRDMTFSYTAPVAPSAAYDTTTVRSPDPVFRRLTNTVDVQLAYHGRPSVVTITALLTAPSGWHSSIALAAPVAFTGSDYLTTVRLDLTDLDARASSAAAATGLPAGPLTVSVVARVDTVGFAEFTPTLALNLSPLQLTLAGDANTLSFHNSTSVPHTGREPNSFNLADRSMTVMQVRTTAAIVVVLVLVSAAILALIARRASPVSEGAAIERRYAPLLAAVHPITTPPNRPLVEVVELETLVKLAERCGLLILHWTRADIATFVVLDERTTYRYRTGVGADFITQAHPSTLPPPPPPPTLRAVTNNAPQLPPLRTR